MLRDARRALARSAAPCSLRLALLLSGAALAVPASAQVVTHIQPDTAPGRSTGTVVTAVGQKTTIDGGTLVGGNLFDSFAAFDLGPGDTAAWTYTAGNPNSVLNVINRVTGGNASHIDGTLDSTGLPKADFYFINPAGIVFGANAQVNVPAAAYFSTASELRFADGAIYSAVTPSGSTLTVAPIAAFGFLGGEGDIAVDSAGPGFFTGAGKLSLSAANLEISNAVIEAGALSLFAAGNEATDQPASSDVLGVGDGAISIDNSLLQTLPSAAADGGISIAGGATTLDASTVRTEAANFAAGGPLQLQVSSLTLDQDSVLSTRSTTAFSAGDVAAQIDGDLIVENGSFMGSHATAAGDAGAVTIAAGSILVDGGPAAAGPSFIRSYSGGTGDAGPVSASAGGAISLVNGGVIASEAFGAGDSGDVTIDADSLSLASGAFITADAPGSGAPGAIDVSANTLAMDGAGAPPGVTGIYTNTVNQNDAGDVTIDVAGATTLQNGASIGAQTFAEGDSGSISVRTGSLKLLSGGFISSSTLGAGDAGDVGVSADSVLIDGAPPGDASSITSTSFSSGSHVGTGNAGNVTLTVGGALTISNGAFIGSDARDATGDAGDVEVTAASLLLDGGAAQAALIESQTYGDGAGGNVSVSVAGSMTIENGARVAANTFGAGDAGDVSVSVGSLLIDSGAAISSDSTTFGQFVGTGDAGTVAVAAVGSLTVRNGGFISSEADDSDGAAGDVSVAAGSILLNGGAAQQAYISSNTYGDGDAGLVSVSSTGALTVEDGASISADTFGAGNAGNVVVGAGSLVLNGGDAQTAFISADSNTDPTGSFVGTGNGGKVTVAVSGDLTIVDGGFVDSSVTDNSGVAGGIVVTARNILIDAGASGDQNSYISSSTNGPGRGGDVTVVATGSLTVRNGGFISADTFGAGDAGNVSIKAASLSIDGGAAQDAFISSDSASDDSGDIGTGNAGKVTVAVTGDIVVRSNGYISTDVADTSGQAGNVSITARNLLLDGTGGVGNTYISSETNSNESGGDVMIALSGNLSVQNGSLISASTFGTGTAGAVTVKADNLTMDAGPAASQDFTSIASNTFGAGAGGDVNISVKHAAVVRDGAAIGADTFGSGDAGKVSVTAGSLLIDGGAAGFATVASASTTNAAGLVGTGDAGEVDLGIAGTLTVQDGGAVSTAADDAHGSAGALNITARDILVDGGATQNSRTQITSSTRGDGSGGALDITATGQLTVTNGAQISARTSGSGDGGVMFIQAPSVDDAAHGDISTSTDGAGDAGVVLIEADSVSVSGGAAIASNANTDPGGASGVVSMLVGSLSITSGGVVETNSVNAHDSGDIFIAGPSVVIDGAGSAISSRNTGDRGGDAGIITVQTDPLTISNGGAITTNSTSGAAGSILLEFEKGGVLTLEGPTPDTIGRITTTSGTSQAGEIIISGASAVILNGSQIQALGPFKGAFVEIDAGTVIESSDRPNLIEVAGAFVFNSQFEDVEKAVTIAGPPFIDASKVLRGECAALARSGASNAFVTRSQGPYAPETGAASGGPISMAPSKSDACGVSPSPD